MVLTHGVKDDMCTGTAVEDVAEDVQLVNGQSLDDVADGDDEIVCTTSGDDGVNNDVDIGGLVGVVRAFVEQFLDDVGEIFRQGFPHLGARVFAADVAADSHQPMDGDVIPVLHVVFGGLDKLYFLLWVVDECTQFALFLVADIAVKEFADLALDVSRSVLQHVLEGFALSVQVGQKMLGTFWQMEYGFEIDDF